MRLLVGLAGVFLALGLFALACVRVAQDQPAGTVLAVALLVGFVSLHWFVGAWLDFIRRLE